MQRAVMTLRSFCPGVGDYRNIANLGAILFAIDMQKYEPALARKAG